MSSVSSITPQNNGNPGTTQAGAVIFNSTNAGITFSTPSSSNIQMTANSAYFNTGVSRIFDQNGSNQVSGAIQAQGTNGILVACDSNSAVMTIDLSGTCANDFTFSSGLGIGNGLQVVQIKPNTSPSAVEFLNCGALVVNSNTGYDIARYCNDSILFQQPNTGTSTTFMSIDKSATTDNIALSNIATINGQPYATGGGVATFIAAPNQSIAYSNITASNVNLFTDFSASNIPSITMASSSNSLTLGLNKTDGAGKVQSYLLTNQTDTQQWNSGTIYQPGALVEYSVQGRSPQIFLAKTGSSNANPIVSFSNWNQITTMLCVGNTSNPPMSVLPQTNATLQSIILSPGSNMTLVDNGSGTLTFNANPPPLSWSAANPLTGITPLSVPIQTETTAYTLNFGTLNTATGSYSGRYSGIFTNTSNSTSNAVNVYIGLSDQSNAPPTSNLVVNPWTPTITSIPSAFSGTYYGFIGELGNTSNANLAFALDWVQKNGAIPRFLNIYTYPAAGSGQLTMTGNTFPLFEASFSSNSFLGTL